jgi:hypothetical protein
VNMKISRRHAVLTGASAAVAGLLPMQLMAKASGGNAQQSADQTHILRHYVLAVANEAEMDRTLAEIQQKLGLPAQAKKHLTELGFTTCMVIIGKTIFETVAPFAPGKRPHVDEFLQQRGGPGVYKLVIQTFDATALRERLYGFRLKLDRDGQFREHQAITLDTEIFGTAFEAFTFTPLEKWWGYDSAIDYVESELVEEVQGCNVVIENPGAVATLVAAVFNAELDPENQAVTFQENHTVPFAARTIRFEKPVDGRRGVTTLDVIVRDRSRVGETVSISGVDFRFV